MALSSDLNCKHSDLVLLGIYKQVLQDNCGGLVGGHFFWFTVWNLVFLFGELMGFVSRIELSESE